MKFTTTKHSLHPHKRRAWKTSHYREGSVCAPTFVASVNINDVISSTRTYDTLNADVKGDFGYGWSLDIATTELSIVYGDGDSARKGFSPYEPIADGTHITITLPDGTKEGFTFQAQGTGYGTSGMFAGIIPSQYYYPNWVPDPGTKSTLHGSQTPLYRWADGTYMIVGGMGGLDTEDYSPARDNGGFLTLTLRNGVDLVIDAINGKLHQAVDMNGNTLTFTDHGITHSSGKGITFDRDNQDRISAITGPDGKRIEYTYDTKGDLVTVTEVTKTGVKTSDVRFTYLTGENVPRHYLDKVIDPLGRTAAKTEFDDQGRIKKVIDADGKVIEYEFDTGSKIQKVKDQLGNVTIIENDDRGNVIREVSPEGAVTLRTYDGKNNVLTETQVVLHNGVEIKLTTTYTYDEDGNKKTEKDARGNITNYTYNKYGQLTSTSSGGVTTKTYYNEQTGLPTTTTDVNGNVTTYKFDDRGNMTSLANSNNVQLISSLYNKYGEVIQITSTNGRTTYMEYDNNGDCIATYYIIESGQKILDTTTYDEARRVIGRAHYVLPSGVLPSGKTIDDYKIWETRTEYNAAGQVVTETDQNKLKTQYIYDVRGLETEVRSQSKGADEQIVWTIQRTVYDAAGRAIYSNSYIEETPNDKIIGSHTEYDRDGRNVRNEQLLGLVIGINTNGNSFVENTGTVLASSATVYNNAGWVISSVDSYGLETLYEYNVFGDVIETQQETIDENGNKAWIITQTEYDSQGRITKETINGASTSYRYDNFGNIIKTTFADGSSISAEYKNSLKVSETNQLGQTRKFEFNDAGQLIVVIMPDGSRYVYDYDKFGNQTLIRDPNGNETKFIYDGFGNQLTRTLPDGSFETFEYNDFNCVTKHVSFEDVVTTFEYDNMGRVAVRKFFDNQINYESKIASETWSFQYDAFGREVEVNQNGRIVKTKYDDFGRILSIQSPEGIISYKYDLFGRQTRVSTDKGDEVQYDYDKLGRLQTVTSEGKTTTYSYDVLGNLVKTTMPNGVVTTYQYNNMNRLIKLTNFFDANQNGVMDSGELVSDFDYNLDSQGRKTHAVETFNINGTEKQNVIDWTYDLNSRLIKEVFDHFDDSLDQTLFFDYDRVGNRLQQKVDKGNDGTIDKVFKYLYDSNDRLIEELFDGQNDDFFEKRAIYGYNHTQQTSKSISENGTIILETTFEYDLQGRMSVVAITTASGTEKITYEYDSNGIRIASIHETNGIVTRTEYLNDSQSLTGYSQVLRQTESVDGVITKTISYVIGHQRISQIVIENGTEQEYYFTFDGHGSTRALLEFTGAIAQLYSFDAYGNAIGFNPAEALTEFLYSSDQFDSKIGQQYLRTRYYDPATGRFNRLDPFFGNLADPQSLHKYLYTHADPVNGIDPSGESLTMALGLGSFGSLGANSRQSGASLSVGRILIEKIYGFASYTSSTLGTFSQFIMEVVPRGGIALQAVLRNPIGAQAAYRIIVKAATAAGVVAASQIPIFFVPQTVMPNIYVHTVRSLAFNPLWLSLNYAPGVSRTNRRAVVGGLGRPGFGWSWDEYPYACTSQGGLSFPAPRVAKVPIYENWVQGGYLSAFVVGTLHLQKNAPFLVVPVPGLFVPSTWWEIVTSVTGTS